MSWDSGIATVAVTLRKGMETRWVGVFLALTFFSDVFLLIYVLYTTLLNSQPMISTTREVSLSGS